MAPPIITLFRYHWLPLAALEVNVTVPGEQTDVLGPVTGEIVGVGGVGLIVTLTAFEASDWQPLCVCVTV